MCYIDYKGFLYDSIPLPRTIITETETSCLILSTGGNMKITVTKRTTLLGTPRTGMLSR